MSKTFIQQLVREGLMSKMLEAGKNSKKAKEPSDKKDSEDTKDPSNQDDDKDLSPKERKKVETLKNKIKNATQGPNRIFKLSQVMGASDAMCGDHKCDPNNASDRSITGKEISGKPDADGNVRTPDLAKLNAMNIVVDNPQAFN